MIFQELGEDLIIIDLFLDRLEILIEAKFQDEVWHVFRANGSLAILVERPETIMERDEHVAEIQEYVRWQPHLLTNANFPLSTALGNLLSHDVYQNLELRPFNLTRAIDVRFNNSIQECYSFVVTFWAQVQVREDFQQLLRRECARMVCVVLLEELHELLPFSVIDLCLALVRQLAELRKIQFTVLGFDRMLQLELLLAVHGLQSQVRQSIVALHQVEATTAVVVVPLEDLFITLPVFLLHAVSIFQSGRPAQSCQLSEPVESPLLGRLELQAPEHLGRDHPHLGCSCELLGAVPLVFTLLCSDKGCQSRPESGCSLRCKAHRQPAPKTSDFFCFPRNLAHHPLCGSPLFPDLEQQLWRQHRCLCLCCDGGRARRGNRCCED
mmetsp:Transcript_32781/g.82920  ORF Transcript_32781/g.82920 Transcript_32781/m.82920 type:complete len:382 (+) Transcript_32781:603-1748(+)